MDDITEIINFFVLGIVFLLLFFGSKKLGPLAWEKK